MSVQKPPAAEETTAVSVALDADDDLGSHLVRVEHDRHDVAAVAVIGDQVPTGAVEDVVDELERELHHSARVWKGE